MIAMPNKSNDNWLLAQRYEHLSKVRDGLINKRDRGNHNEILEVQKRMTTISRWNIHLKVRNLSNPNIFNPLTSAVGKLDSAALGSIEAMKRLKVVFEEFSE